MKLILAIVLSIVIVAVVLWAVFGLLPRLLRRSAPMGSAPEAPNQPLFYTMKSALPELFSMYGTRSLVALRCIFELEQGVRLVVYDDDPAQRLQIYDRGPGATPRWTVLLPFQRDPEGRRYHPLFRFDERMVPSEAIDDVVYPGPDYRTWYGRKVTFSSLPFDVRVHILTLSLAPEVEGEYVLPEK